MDQIVPPEQELRVSCFTNTTYRQQAMREGQPLPGVVAIEFLIDFGGQTMLVWVEINTPDFDAGAVINLEREIKLVWTPDGIKIAAVMVAGYFRETIPEDINAYTRSSSSPEPAR